MLSDKFYEVLKNEGIVTIVTWGVGEPHIVNEWNSYLVVTEDERILLPSGVMHRTEENIKVNNKIKMALGSKNVLGFDDYPGTGFVVEGRARFFQTGIEYEMMKDMNLSEIRERSTRIREHYHKLEEQYHGEEWSIEEDALAFLTDAGLVGRLTMAQQGRWPKGEKVEQN